MEEAILKHIVGAGLTIAALSVAASAHAACGSFPYTLANNSTADANQVMADLNCLLVSPNFTGPVGIGDSSPTAQLTISNGTNSGYGLNVIGNVNNWMGAQIYNSNSGSLAFSYLQLGNNNSQYAAALGINSGSNNTFGAVNALWLMNWLNAPVVLGTSGDPRVTIDGSGNVGVDTSYPSYALQVNGNAAGNAAWINLSDGRLKTNVTPLKGGLAVVEALRPVHFNWRASADRSVGKDLKLSTTESHVGFIAQDVQAVVPEAVAAPADANGLYGLKESDLVPVLVEAIQELQAEVTQLKAQVAAKSNQ